VSCWKAWTSSAIAVWTSTAVSALTSMVSVSVTFSMTAETVRIPFSHGEPACCLAQPTWPPRNCGAA
jgi:hypothetical protein